MIEDTEKTQGKPMALDPTEESSRSLLCRVCCLEDEKGSRDQNKGESQEKKTCREEEEEEKMDGVSLTTLR